MASLAARAKLFSGAPGHPQLAEGTPFGEAFPGGVRVAAGDVNGDGVADVITGPAAGVGTVKIFTSGTTPAGELFAFDPGFAGGPGHIRVFNGVNGYAGANNLVSLMPGSVANAGGSQPHLNMQPFLTLNFCIALVGIFPSRNFQPYLCISFIISLSGIFPSQT